MRVFLDTNVLVSAYTTRGICADLLRYILAEHELLTGEVNLVELRRVLRDRFHASPELTATIEAELRDTTIVPKPERHPCFPFVIRMTSGCLHRQSRAEQISWSLETKTCWPSHLNLHSPLSIRAVVGIVSASRNGPSDETSTETRAVSLPLSIRLRSIPCHDNRRLCRRPSPL